MLTFRDETSLMQIKRKIRVNPQFSRVLGVTLLMQSPCLEGFWATIETCY